MPISPSYPGVYIEEIPSGVRTITGVPTSITAFIGRAKRGPVNEPRTIGNFGDYERIFGGLWEDSTMSYAVRDFFMNGGSQAIIVRLYHPSYPDEETREKDYDSFKSIAQNAASDETDAIVEAAQAYDTPTDSIIGAGKEKYNSLKSEPAKEIAAKYVLDAIESANKLKASAEDVANAVNAAKATADSVGKIAGYAVGELAGITDVKDIPKKINDINGDVGKSKASDELIKQAFNSAKNVANVTSPVTVAKEVSNYIQANYTSDATFADKVNKSIAEAVNTAINDANDKYNKNKQPVKVIRAAYAVNDTLTAQKKIIDLVIGTIKNFPESEVLKIAESSRDALTYEDFSGTDFSGKTTLCAIIYVASGIICSEVDKVWQQSYSAGDVAKVAKDVKDLTKNIGIATGQATQEIKTVILKAENSNDTAQNLIANIDKLYTIDSGSSVQTKVKFIVAKALWNVANKKTAINEIKRSIEYAVKVLSSIVESIVETIADSLVEAANKVLIDGAKSSDLVIAAYMAVDSAIEKATSILTPISKAILHLGTESKNFLILTAASEGSWGNDLQASIDYLVNTELKDSSDLFNLTVRDPNTGKKETYRNLSVKSGHKRNIEKVLQQESTLVAVSGSIPDSRPNETYIDKIKDQFDTGNFVSINNNDYAADSQPLKPNDYIGQDKCGIRALDAADLFNLLCIPADLWDDDTKPEVYQYAMKYCADKRAILIVDPPHNWGTSISEAAEKPLNELFKALNGDGARNAVLYFPRVKAVDPLRDGQINTFVPCGIIAGVISRTDAQRGVWKAPAGLSASLNGIAGLQVNMTDFENGLLNPKAINCLRLRPAAGPVIWGARTMRGNDSIGDEYKYLPIRRTALFIEETLYRSLQWVVFEPNDEPLWAQIRLNVGAFMHGLFQQGAFQGKTRNEAYFVKCDKETNPQDEINQGKVNVVVGFAPLKPAEFVIIKVQQITGQIQM